METSTDNNNSKQTRHPEEDHFWDALRSIQTSVDIKLEVKPKQK